MRLPKFRFPALKLRIALPKNRILRWGVLPGIALAVIAIGVVGLIFELNRPHNVSNPNVPFTVSSPAAATTTSPQQKPQVSSFTWPLYGYTLDRTRDYSAASSDLRPPFRVGWRHGRNALLEFSPSIHDDGLYYMDDSATVKRLNIHTGHLVWSKQIGSLAAATPALDPKDGLLFLPTLATTGHHPGNGRFVALSMTTGHVRWSIPLSGGGESSAAYDQGVVYFGSQSGIVYAVDAKTGHVKWTFHAAGSVKGGPAFAGGLMYFGDYAGKVYALHVATGKLAWEAGTGSGAFGFGVGTFYATPAVAFGRVYIGNTNGFVYSFSATNGELAWSRGTSAYVYASASVTDTPGLGPTIYIGSYDGNFYALNARTGAVRWIHRDGYRISGSSTIIGNIVYYSDFNHHTTGLNIRTGKVVFTFKAGFFTPMVATPNALYLNGSYTMYELLPKTAKQPAAKPKQTAKKQQAKTTKTGASKQQKKSKS